MIKLPLHMIMQPCRPLRSRDMMCQDHFFKTKRKGTHHERTLDGTTVRGGHHGIHMASFFPWFGLKWGSMDHGVSVFPSTINEGVISVFLIWIDASLVKRRVLSEIPAQTVVSSR